MTLLQPLPDSVVALAIEGRGPAHAALLLGPALAAGAVALVRQRRRRHGPPTDPASGAADPTDPRR